MKAAFAPRFCAAAFLALLFFFAAGPRDRASEMASKPKIRAVTAFIRLDRATYQAQIADALDFLRRAKAAFEKDGFEVQTIRITTQPFPEYTKGLTPEEALAFLRGYDALAVKEGDSP